MKRRIIIMLVIVALFCYGVYILIPDKQAKATPSATASPMPTATEAEKTCEVMTGISEGRVNLRACPGTACPVLSILSDGQALTVIQAGEWNQVITEDGAAGWVKSNYCKGK